MSRTKNAKNKIDSSVEITKDLADSTQVTEIPEVEQKEIKYIDVTDSSFIDDIKGLFSDNEKKILELSEDSKKQNKDLLDRLAKDEMPIKKSGFSKKHLLFALLLLSVFAVGYYKRDYIKDKLMLWWANRQLEKGNTDE